MDVGLIYLEQYTVVYFEHIYFLLAGSTPEEIRTSYKRLALKWHPDKHNNSTESTKVCEQ